MSPIKGPILATDHILCSLMLVALAGPALAAPPVEMRLLVLGATGTEPSFLAIRSVLDHLGTPYEAVALAKGQSLPALEESGKGLFQAILLATGNLGVCDPDCRSALSRDEWSRLDAYAAAYSVRTASFFTFPDPRFGLIYRDGLFSPLDAPSTLSFAPEAGNVFPYLRQESGILVGGAFAYLADPAPSQDETTTPILLLGERVLGAVHTKPDGREYLALTFDQSPYLRHSLELSYGVIAWATKGLFIGSRRAYLTPQSDDLFLPNNLFTDESGPCSTSQFLVNPTAPLGPTCPKIRIAGQDLVNLREWQANWNAQPQTARFKVTMAFNGLGARSDAEDSLTQEVRRSLSDFFWINHTFTHKILDCYGLQEDGSCRPANYDESFLEIKKNLDAAEGLGIPVDLPSLITPAVSGLQNRDLLDAAAALGVRYLVSDTSRPEGNPVLPNTGIHPSTHPEMLFVPRRATNVFYNAATAEESAPGSLTDEYNYFFGPEGIVRVGGADGPPFFSSRQSYEQIINRESDALVNYILRHELYPSMFHQSNFYTYQEKRSLFSDTLDATLQKFIALSNLPVVSLTQTDIGKLMERRMGFQESGARMTLVPGESITITVEKPATISITGVCAGECEQYAGEWQSGIAVEPGTPVVVSLKQPAPEDQTVGELTSGAASRISSSTAPNFSKF